MARPQIQSGDTSIGFVRAELAASGGWRCNEAWRNLYSAWSVISVLAALTASGYGLY
jgi:hypothetical protein